MKQVVQPIAGGSVEVLERAGLRPVHRHRHALRGDPPTALRSPARRVVSPAAEALRAPVHHGKQASPSFSLDRPGGNPPRDRSSGSLVGRGGRQLRSDRAYRLWGDPGVGRLTFGRRRPATHGNRHDGSSHRSGAQPLAHVLRSVRVRDNCLSHLDAQPVETSARNPWILRAAGAGLR